MTERLRAPGRHVVGVDPAWGMAARASGRLPGRIVLGEGGRLPFADSRFDAVTAIWLLHLLTDAEPVIAECARVLRPGGVFLATVDKDAGHDIGSDVDALFAPLLRQHAPDACGQVLDIARSYGLGFAGEAWFTGRGQGRTPRRVAEVLRAGWYASRVVASSAELEELARAMERLPDPDVSRGEPRFRVLALRAAKRDG